MTHTTERVYLIEVINVETEKKQIITQSGGNLDDAKERAMRQVFRELGWRKLTANPVQDEPVEGMQP